jgi:aerobic-type carbon monoxide dehydrogenase small subunit (CoxS/CutS family)
MVEMSELFAGQRGPGKNTSCLVVIDGRIVRDHQALMLMVIIVKVGTCKGLRKRILSILHYSSSEEMTALSSSLKDGTIFILAWIRPAPGGSK